MNIIKTPFYRLGGADFEVIKDCSKKTKVRYLNLARALIITVALAGIGGFDIASQFTPSVPVRVAVAVGWAVATLSFDFFLINGGPAKGLFKYIRIMVGFANICITITALFILLNQATIDSQINLKNSNSIKTIDETYLKAKENRYAAIVSKKAEAEKYNTEVVLPEARNGYPGPKYGEKKLVYDGMATAVNDETAKLDLSEEQYFKAYQTERSAIESIQSNDFFAKAKLLPEVMLNGGWLTLFLAGCLFIFLSYIELQAISLKLAMSDDDEYHIAEKDHETRTGDMRATVAKSNTAREHKKILLNAAVQDKVLEEEEYVFTMSDLDDRIVREAEIRGKIAILRAKGYSANADRLESELERFINTSQKSAAAESGADDQQKSSPKNNMPAAEILKITQPMADMLESIQNASVPEDLTESIFNWIINNIIYDKGHGKFFYRTARETYNDGHGICGELSVVYMAFLRAAGIDASFVEVTKDQKGDEVSHACVLINQNNSQFLSDPAYNSFVVEHQEWKVWSDEKLAEEYHAWNR